jgi:BTB/POZ domain
VNVGSGTNQFTFKVHENVLIETPFFQACLQSGFVESTRREVNLPEDDPAAMEQVLLWLYLGRTDICTARGDETIRAVQTFVLADNLLVERLANDILDMFQDYCQLYIVPTAALIEIIRYGAAAGRLKEMLLQQLENDTRYAGWDNYVREDPRLLELRTDRSIAGAHDPMRVLTSSESGADPSWSLDPCE